MMTDTERRPIILRRTARGLEPPTAGDAEMLDRYGLGQDVEVTIKARRSLPQLRLYWAMLSRVIEATGAYPSADHLHSALKQTLGYTTPIKTLDGELLYWPDSVAFAKMDAMEFKAFFDAAVAKIAEKWGFDPLAGTEAA